MSTPEQPAVGEDLPPYVPVSPLLPDDPPRVGEFWLDARLAAGPAGVAFTAHRGDRRPGAGGDDEPAMVILLSEGAAADPAARDRFAGTVNRMHIDTVLARGGQGQSEGRLGRRYRSDDDAPVTPDDRPVAPWVALAYDGSPRAAAEAVRVLDSVELATLPPQGAAAGPDYRHYWISRVRPGLARLWPLPWPGRFDRAGWRTILVSWLLMLLIGALAVLIAILIFRNQPPQSPQTPTGGSPPPQSQSGSPPPQSGSPSGSPSPQSGSPSGSPSSGSPSPSGSQSGSGSPSESPSQSGSQSGSPSTSGGTQPTQSGQPGEQSPGSRL